ncbi:hypothetical protein [Embleya sp. AB8]|uniref:hypothetical protein n=1 Tax=Embleya sp. AB8 TaxID=3156304 RepID=UPI003C748F99
MKSPRIAISLALAAAPLLVLVGAASAGATEVYPATEYELSGAITAPPAPPTAAHSSPIPG